MFASKAEAYPSEATLGLLTLATNFDWARNSYLAQTL